LDRFESVRLFIQAAVQAHPDFVLDDANAADIAAICREVDGLPLAVELAAAQMQVLAPHQLLQVLRERFEVLGGPRRALPRQQTLRTIINWSWQNLGATEQGLLCAVAACAGGGDLDAVMGVADPQSSPVQTVSGLSRLADLSLITVVHSATAARYRVLETVSQFVLEKLSDCGRLAAQRDRHLAHFCRRTAGWGSDWGGPHDARALADADLNHENVSKAIDWALSMHRWQEAASLTARLFPWWTARTGAALGLEQTDAVLEIAPADAGGDALADLCCQASAQALRRGDLEHARAYATRLLDIATRDGNRTKQFDARIQLARCDDRDGRSTQARQALEAIVLDARSQALPVVLGDALNVLGHVQWSEGDLRGARLTFSESAQLGQRLGRLYDAVVDTLNLAGIELECDDAPQARRWLSGVAGERASTNHRYVDQMWLDLAAWLAAVEGDWARTARGIRFAERLAAELHHARSAHWVDLRERCLAQARMALGATEFDAAWSHGEAVSLQAALAEVDAWLSRSDSAGRGD
jgi:non-specific serine/threonine protein kinase